MLRALCTVILVLGLTAPAFADETATPETNESNEKYGKTEGLLGDIIVGPKLTLFGGPVPFRVGLEAKWQNLVGLSFDYGFFPTLSFSSVSVGLKGWNLAGKVYPWKRGFFVGVGIGGQTFTGSKTDTTINDTLTVDMKTTYILPQIGWRWVTVSGFFWGMELGAQIPMSTTTTATHSDPTVAATPQATQLSTDVTDKANTFGNKTIPAVALLQFGYFL